MYKIVSLLILTFCLGCAQSKKGEIWQKSRDKVVNVQNRIKEISMDEVLISNNSRMCLLGDYLIVRDNKAVDKQIHLLDKNTFRYLTVHMFAYPKNFSYLCNIIVCNLQNGIL